MIVSKECMDCGSIVEVYEEDTVCPECEGQIVDLLENVNKDVIEKIRKEKTK